MTTKSVTMAANSRVVEIQTDGELWGFKVGDIISDTTPIFSCWFNKRVVVQGFSDGRLYGIVESEETAHAACNPEGLTLLERPGLSFKVGDRVMELSGKIGTVIVLDPKSNSLQPYLVAYDNWNNGHEAVGQWGSPWFPQSLKNPSAKNYWWERDITIEPAPASGQAGNNQVVVPTTNPAIPHSVNLNATAPANPDTAVNPAAGSAGNTKIIQLVTGGHLTVRTEDELWGFKAGDIITETSVGALWFNRRVVVQGFRNEELWGIIESIDERATYSSDPIGLILLERPGYKFKVGDYVIHPQYGRGQVIVLCPTNNGLTFLVAFDKMGISHRTQYDYDWQWPWFPEKYKTAVDTNFSWCEKDQLELAPAAIIGQGESPTKTQPESEKTIMTPVPTAQTMSAWAQEMLQHLSARAAHLFVLYGNVGDWQRGLDGQFYELINYLTQKLFTQRQLVMTYSLSEGLKFLTPEMEQAFRQDYLTPPDSGQPDPTSAVAKAAQKAQQQMAHQALRDPERVLPLLERCLLDKKEGFHRALIIDFAHNLAPASTSGTPHTKWEDRINTETLQRWAKNPALAEAGSAVVLIAPQLSLLADGLKANDTPVKLVRLPKPNETSRVAFWQRCLASDGVKVAAGLDEQVLGRVSNGLSLRQIETVYQMARQRRQVINLEHIRHAKQEILEAEFGGRLRVKMPQWGFDFFGGKTELKDYFREIRENILTGMWRRVPMGILAVGPPGTGKTFFFECWAKECGFTVVEMVNPRVMWVGQSEQTMSEMLDALDDLAPVVVIEDEADQSEPSRDAPNGDSGVSERLRQMKFKFCSAPERRGKVIWVRLTNRDDLLDAAYKRKGRTDDNIPFVLPDVGELADIFRVMFARYEIPTKIIDFTPYAILVAQKQYCTGADVEWMVLEADKFAGREGLALVKDQHLRQAVEDWEMDLNPREVERQIYTALRGSSKRLRPKNWPELLERAEIVLGIRQKPESPVGQGVISLAEPNSN